MSRMTFTNEQDDGATTVVTFEAVQIDDITKQYEHFLRGCGFHFDGEFELLTTSYIYGDPSEERGDA